MLPRWVTSASGQDIDSVSFTSGAALAMLDVVLRDRMALNAAVACLKLENWRETASDIRDAVCMARAGDAIGPRWRYVYGLAQSITDHFDSNQGGKTG